MRLRVLLAGCVLFTSVAVSADPTPLEKADASVKAAVAKAETDPARPSYHFRAPAQWINDPNGPIYYKGWYHVFYQHNPFGDDWGHMHWGHARSKDLLHWEHLPIALGPSIEKGEEHCFSGCCTLDASDKPMIFYTSIGKREPEQWAAVAQDDDLITWKKLDKPVLTQADNGAAPIREWRDPCVFRDGDKTYLVTGGMLDKTEGCVELYEADGGDLTKWKRRGTLHQEAGDIECPLFFKLGQKWVLIISIHGRVKYLTGTFDPAAGKFKKEVADWVDDSEQFYAPNTLLDAKGNRILIGWVRGWKAGTGWNGCFSLPRELTLADDGTLRQLPVGNLAGLFGEETTAEGFTLSADSVMKLPAAKGDALCLFLKADPAGPAAFGMNVRVSEDGKRKIAITWEKGQLNVDGKKYLLQPTAEEKAVNLVAFVDKGMLEIYAQNGRICVTRVLNVKPEDQNVEIFSRGGALEVEKLKTWPVGSTWGK